MIINMQIFYRNCNDAFWLPYLCRVIKTINIMKNHTHYYIERGNGYGQYSIVKVTPKGKETRMHSTDSQAWDDSTEGKCSQRRLKRLFNR